MKNIRLPLMGTLLGAVTLLHAAIPPAESLLPSDTLAFFTVPDCAVLREATKTSPQMMFWSDPAMKPFREKFTSMFTETILGPLEKDLGIKIDDFLAPLQGQFTAAITLNGAKANDDTTPGIVLLLDARNQSDLLGTNIAKLTKKWTEKGRTLRTEKLGAINYKVLTLATNDLKGMKRKKPGQADGDSVNDTPVKPVEIYFAQHNSLLIVGNSPKLMEGIANRLTLKTAPVIGDDPLFAADKLSQFRNSPAYYGWLNANKIISMLLAEKPKESDPMNPMASLFSPEKILSATGLGALKSASFAVHELPDGSMVTFNLNVPEAARKGIFKILSLPAKDASIPSFIPSDAVKFTRIRLDGKQLWEEIQKIVSALAPEGQSSLNSVIDMANTMAQQKNPAFDLRTYLFGNLRDDIIIYQKAPAGDSIEQFANPPSIYLISVANTDQVIDAIKTIAGMSSPQDNANNSRDYQGHKIHTIKTAASMAQENNPESGSIFISSANDYVAISSNASILEEYLRSEKNKPLRETPGIIESATRTGGTGGGLFSYENQRETIRSTFKLLKSKAGISAFSMLPPQIRKLLDFSLLPEYEAVSKYFHFTTTTASANENGLTLKAFAPRPPQISKTK